MPIVPPPVLTLAAALAQRSLARRRPSSPIGRSTPTVARSVATAAVLLPLVALAGAAGREFRRRGTTVEPLHPDRASALVTSGSNGLTRNPMYVGMTGLLVAHAIWRGSWVAWPPVAAFVAVIDRFQIRAEEAALTEKFGAPYEAYRASTPRWLDARSLGVWTRS